MVCFASRNLLMNRLACKTRCSNLALDVQDKEALLQAYAHLLQPPWQPERASAGGAVGVARDDNAIRHNEELRRRYQERDASAASSAGDSLYPDEYGGPVRRCGQDRYPAVKGKQVRSVVVTDLQYAHVQVVRDL